MTYVDGFVLCLPRENLEAYRSLAESAGKIWKEHGALAYVETVHEDMTKHDFCSDFETLARPKEGEVVVFSYIAYPSREERDRINAAVMADERMKDGCNPETMPFDVKRMAYGGFQSIVSL